jgi:hypothetical protein
VKANEGYVWLRRTGLYWLFWCETTAMALFMSGFISAPVLAAFGVRLGVALGTAGALVGAGIVLASIESYLLYNAIRCPHCAYNPNRTAGGRRVPYGIKTVWGRLESLKECAQCGS